LTSRSQFITLSENHIFSPTLLNTARISFSRTNPASAPVVNPSQTGQQVVGPDVSFANGQPIGLIVIGSNGTGNPNFTTMGPDFAAPNYHLQNYWSVSEDLFYTKGKHALKFGFLGNRIQIITGETVWNRGRVNFAGGLPAFLQNQPSQVFAAIPGGVERRHFTYETFGFVSAQTGFAFTAAAPGDVSLNTTTNINSGYERPELVTSANLGDVTTCVGATGLTPLGRQCNVNAVVYNSATVITGDPNRWFNPNMFATPIPGYLGNVARGSLTGPGLFNWDFSLHKNTPLGFLGETGNLQFRAEFFNILNRANFINNLVQWQWNRRPECRQAHRCPGRSGHPVGAEGELLNNHRLKSGRMSV
jgi:hypothetical protein